MTTRSKRRWCLAVAATTAGLVASGCGLPDGGATKVHAEDVPYRLLAPADRSAGSPPPTGSTRPSGALVFWVDADDRLVPSEASTSCDEPVAAQVAHLLDLLSSGPTDEVRTEGWSSAWMPSADLSLEAIEGSTAVISVDATTQTSADRLPLAIGQVTLSVTTAAVVSEVRFTDGEQEPLAVPLPGGAFTDAPVRRTDYARLAVGAGRERWPGCP
ncbi:GerMN domain-containing protein [Nocardioides ganghwensis]|uniref:GerMN domain-containing protein n=1 Tax=Nocardioides ganghwensis TaxID=252230 RepID=A0A4Q2SEK0_9ACTN|nr:GerMN domain-containing protein [Nocardioides ganghwensis]MBD3946168.1 GerMN domain-containing protein [Nocardioides ganghwensis]RYC03492.1 hypothetical protein EUA07_05765 [Nocardioides ganghwensis]